MEDMLSVRPLGVTFNLRGIETSCPRGFSSNFPNTNIFFGVLATKQNKNVEIVLKKKDAVGLRVVVCFSESAVCTTLHRIKDIIFRSFWGKPSCQDIFLKAKQLVWEQFCTQNENGNFKITVVCLSNYPISTKYLASCLNGQNLCGARHSSLKKLFLRIQKVILIASFNFYSFPQLFSNRLLVVWNQRRIRPKPCGGRASSTTTQPKCLSSACSFNPHGLTPIYLYIY